MSGGLRTVYGTLYDGVETLGTPTRQILVNELKTGFGLERFGLATCLRADGGRRSAVMAKTPLAIIPESRLP
jgi:hypothetical protein